VPDRIQIVAAALQPGEELLVPIFIGEGIPLIVPGRCTVPLKLISCTKFTDGVVKLHYAVG
jgi:hypothetical protein